MTIDEVLKRLHGLADPKNIQSMARFGVDTKNALGITIPELRRLAQAIGKDHALALALWKTGIHEARILASVVAQPDKLTEKQMDAWVHDFNSWDICDQTCSNLFRYVPAALQKPYEWSLSKEEFVKRTSFAFIAALAAIKGNNTNDQQFVRYFPLIKKAATDERNFVKKAVNWALRQIGKRNLQLNALAIQVAHEIVVLDSKSARWIARDAIRELTSFSVKKRLNKG